MVMPACEIVAEFMGHENYQECEGERQAIQKRRRMAVGEAERLEESVERGGLVVRVGGSEVRAGEQRGEQGQENEGGSECQRAPGRMPRNGLIIGRGR